MQLKKIFNTKSDVNGNPTFIKINLEKYGADLEPLLKKIGVLLPKDPLDLEIEKSLASQEARKILINKNNTCWNK